MEKIKFQILIFFVLYGKYIFLLIKLSYFVAIIDNISKHESRLTLIFFLILNLPGKTFELIF